MRSTDYVGDSSTTMASTAVIDLLLMKIERLEKEKAELKRELDEITNGH